MSHCWASKVLRRSVSAFVRRPVQLAGFVPVRAFTFGADLRSFLGALARHPTVLAPFAEETFDQDVGHKEPPSRGILFAFTTIPLGRLSARAPAA